MLDAEKLGFVVWDLLECTSIGAHVVVFGVEGHLSEVIHHHSSCIRLRDFPCRHDELGVAIRAQKLSLIQAFQFDVVEGELLRLSVLRLQVQLILFQALEQRVIKIESIPMRRLKHLLARDMGPVVLPNEDVARLIDSHYVLSIFNGAHEDHRQLVPLKELSIDLLLVHRRELPLAHLQELRIQ